MERELATQPEIWAAAAALAAAGPLPGAAASACASIGCGTSLFMAQAYAALRERAGHGWTDAFAASELPAGPPLRRARRDLALRHHERGRCTRSAAALGGPHGGDHRRRRHARSAERADAAIGLPFADERSIVQTRFAPARSRCCASRSRPAPRPPPPADAARAALRGAAARRRPGGDRAVDVPRAAAGRSASPSEAALKLRESAQAWTEAYPLFEYRHGPISIAAPGRVIWSLEPLEPAVAGRAARDGRDASSPSRSTRSPGSSAPSARGRAGPRARPRPRPPAQPDPLRRARRARPGAAGVTIPTARKAITMNALRTLLAVAALAACLAGCGGGGDDDGCDEAAGERRAGHDHASGTARTSRRCKAIKELVDEVQRLAGPDHRRRPARRASPTTCCRR